MTRQNLSITRAQGTWATRRNRNVVKTIMKGRVAVLFAAVIALLFAPTAAASAATPSAAIDPDATGTLVITKLVQPDQDGDPATGAPTAVDGVGLGGVTFTAQRVPGVNLLSAAGWDSALGMDVEDAAEAIANDGQVVTHTGTTGPSGVLELTGLDLGLYLVTETAVPDGVQKSVRPFLVTLPMPHPEIDDAWLYAVHVYPKNEIDLLSKSVGDSRPMAFGNAFTYDLLMDIPEGSTALRLTDVFPDGIGFDPDADGAVKLLAVSREDGSADPTVSSLENAVVTFDAETRKLVVTFDSPDARRLLAENGRLGVRVTVTANKVGLLDNHASYVITTPGGEIEGDSNVVTTKWGELTVTKTSAESHASLPGAVFGVADSLDNAKGGVFLARATTDENGVAKFGLRYSDFKNGIDIDDEHHQPYWLVEIQPPAGYQLDAENAPRKILITGANNGVETAAYENEQRQPLFDLPLIGGNRAILPILAAIVVGGGVIWLVRSRRANG